MIFMLSIQQLDYLDLSGGGVWDVMALCVLILNLFVLLFFASGANSDGYSSDRYWTSARQLLAPVSEWLNREKNRTLMYRSARNITAVTTALWIAEFVGVSVFILFVNYNILVYATLIIDIVVICVFMWHGRNIRSPDVYLFAVFLPLLVLTVISGTPILRAAIPPINTTPLHIITAIVAITTVLSRFRLIRRSNDTELWGKYTGSEKQSIEDIDPPSGGVEALNWVRTKSTVYTAGLVVLVSLGFLIRTNELTGLPPYPDEYFHLLAARDMIWNSQLIPSYTRAFLPVTLPVSLSFLLFEPGLFTARLVMVIFNLLAVIPLYYLVRKINRFVALVAVLLYITNPWVIAVSRTVREYAVLPLFMFTVALLFVSLLERIDDDIKLKEYVERPFDTRSVLFVVVFIAPIGYAAVDNLSTFKTVAGLYALFFAIVGYRLDWTNRFNRRFVAVCLPTFAVAGGYFVSNQSFLSLVPSYQQFAIDLFFNNPSQQWYYDRSSVLVSIILFYGVVYTLVKRNTVAIVGMMAFVGYLYMFAFHFVRYTRPRYAFLLELWFIIFFAISIYFFNRFLIELAPDSITWTKSSKIAAVGIILILLINPAQVALASNLHDSEDYKGTYVPITVEHHIDAESGLAPLESVHDEAELILIHRPAHLEWYYPQLAADTEVRMYRCNDGNEKDYSEALRDIDEKKTVIITDWRSNRNNCISSHPRLEAFDTSSISEYTVFTNFER